MPTRVGTGAVGSLSWPFHGPGSHATLGRHMADDEGQALPTLSEEVCSCRLWAKEAHSRPLGRSAGCIAGAGALPQFPCWGLCKRALHCGDKRMTNKSSKSPTRIANHPREIPGSWCPANQIEKGTVSCRVSQPFHEDPRPARPRPSNN